MSPIPQLWESIAAPFRGGDLHECVRQTRAAVDAQPYDLPPRYLLASLYLALGEPGLAQLQYERLLPLAVGRGELFLALAAQRRLDELHPPTTLHARRYHAMHQWFVSLARSERRRRVAEGLRSFGPQLLVRLTSAEFADAAERCRVETFGAVPRLVAPEAGLLWVVIHGRVRWTALRDDAPEGESVIADPGDIIVLPTSVDTAMQLRIEPETPAECLCLDPELFSVADGPPGPPTRKPAEEPAPTPAETAADAQVAELVAAATAPLEVGATPPAAPPGPATVSPVRSPRPVPDPIAEPTTATAAPIERRRENRLSVQVANGVVMLGLAGTRVAPLPGALVELSARGMGVRFRRGDLLQEGVALREAVVSVHLVLPGDRGVERLAARVVWVDRDPAATDPESALGLGLEFVALSPAQQTRLERATAAGAAAPARR